MKIILLNGSPRMNGNTKTALCEIMAGIQLNIPSANVELIDVTEHQLSGCNSCGACKENGGVCITPDDSAKIVQKVFDAEVVIFGTPVYYWGITAQLKMAIDKLYSKSEQFHQQKKKIGIVAVGEADLSDKEYSLIHDQFQCICDYLGWKIIFNQSISACKAGEIKEDTKKMQELKELWKTL